MPRQVQPSPLRPEAQGGQGYELLKARYRLRRKMDFQATLQGRRVFSGRGLVVLAVPSERAESRIGVTVSRQLKRAVDRNRARRRLRELARTSFFQADSGADRRGIRYDVVLIARPAALTLRFADLKEETDQAALRLIGPGVQS